MDNNLKQLIELQKIDSRLLSIEELRGDLPNIVDNLGGELKTIKEEENNAKDRIQEVVSDIRKQTALVDDSTVKLKKLKEQLYLVKSNKEYDSLNFEIDHLKEIIDNSENIIIDLEEEKESIDEKSKNFQIDIKDATKTLNQKSTELKTTMSKTEKEENELNKLRLKIIDKIENKFLFAYDRLRRSREGLGIMNILSNACGSCYTQLPRQTVIEDKDNSSVISCPSCSIYLFFDEELD